MREDVMREDAYDAKLGLRKLKWRFENRKQECARQ
jgi:hypothetical protein